MTKQEEIREGIAEDIYCATGNEKEWCLRFTEQLFRYLHSQGVVIKVDRGSDDIQLPILKETWEGMVEDMKELGYVAVEPLMKPAPSGVEE